MQDNKYYGLCFLLLLLITEHEGRKGKDGKALQGPKLEREGLVGKGEWKGGNGTTSCCMARRSRDKQLIFEHFSSPSKGVFLLFFFCNT